MSGVAREISLEEFAAISAAIAEGDLPVDQVLASSDLTLARWSEISMFHSYGIASDDAVADAYAEAFVRAQDRLKPVPSMTPEAWAALVVEMAREGPSSLARRGLRSSDHLRLTRHWAKKLGSDKALAARYATAFYAAS
jgi:hypothetical protein